MRPETLVVVTGTATEVGKTFVTAAAVRALRAGGVAARARKPVQSYEPGTIESATDAGVLAAAGGWRADSDAGWRAGADGGGAGVLAGGGEGPVDVCPAHRWYEVAMAPPMAAEVLARPAFSVGDLVGELAWPAGTAVGFVEGVGGPRSPLASDGDTVDLANALGPDHVVLVADAGLGTINAVRLSAAAFGGRWPLLVVLNRFDPADDLHRRNLRWLADDGFDVMCDGAELARRLAAGQQAAPSR